MQRFFISVLLLWASAGHSAQVSVAVATNFAQPMKQIARQFERDSGHRVLLSFGASGKIYAQIRNGAPFELFLSADQQKPAQLVRDGLALGHSRFTYATGSLVLWSRSAQLIDNSPAVLKAMAFNKLALANPRTAPYGAAAMEVLAKLQLDSALDGRIVQGENVNQTYQFVHSGNAELGFIALSQLRQAKGRAGGSSWQVPASLHSPIRQDAILLQRGRNNPAALALLDYIRRGAGGTIAAFGYGAAER